MKPFFKWAKWSFLPRTQAGIELDFSKSSSALNLRSLPPEGFRRSRSYRPELLELCLPGNAFESHHEHRGTG